MFLDKIEKRMVWTTSTSSSGNVNWSSFSETTVESEYLLKESTYNKCIKYNGESVAKCPLIVKQCSDLGDIEAIGHKYFDKLRLRPNPYMTISDCLKTFIALGEHEGISALLITKNGDLYPARVKEIIVDDLGIFNSPKNNPLSYILDIAGCEVGAFDKECIIYRSGISWDNIKNVNATKDYLKDTIKTTVEGQRYLSKLFSNGMCSKVLVQFSSDIKDNAELKKSQAKFDKLYSSDGRTFVAPAGVSISPLNMSLTDSQFSEIRSLSRKEIANAFGLSPSMIGEGEGDIEKDTLRYLQDTLLFKLQSLEQEFDYKLLTANERKKGYKIRFNTNVLLRTSPSTQATILDIYVRDGIYTLNDAKRILGMPTVDGGDETLLPSGETTLKDLLLGNASWQNGSKPIDTTTDTITSGSQVDVGKGGDKIGK